MGQQGGSSLQSLLGQYSVPIPDIAQAYMRSFQRGGPIDVPSYQELYGSYRDVAEREAGRQGAQITNSFGSQGARYSSDLLNAQRGLRSDLTQNLTNQSGNLLQGLRQQQFGEASGLANLQYGIEEGGMA